MDFVIWLLAAGVLVWFVYKHLWRKDDESVPDDLSGPSGAGGSGGSTDEDIEQRPH